VTDLPYTDADLRHEATRQLKNTTEDADFVGIGEQMTGTVIPSRTGEPRACWHDLDDLDGDAFGDAQRAIDDLLSKAADTSAWAITLGADQLAPAARVIDIGGPDGGIAGRLHFAFDPTMPHSLRDEVIDDITRTLAPVIPLRSTGGA
jgi:hypothetical protein